MILSDERKLILEKYILHNKSREEFALINLIFAEIRMQDKEFIKEVKKAFGYFEDEQTDGLGFSDNSFIEDLDELAGDELIWY